jgi:hypothetical protein
MTLGNALLRLWGAAFLVVATTTIAGVAGTAAREAAEAIFAKFGKGAAGQTVEEIASTTTRTVAKHGDGALPLLRKSGHAGFTALESAGDKAPSVIKLYARKGDEAIWVISEPKKLSIFLKHGDSAADALLKHPGIADTLIGRYGDNAVGALNSISRQSAQRLNIVADEGLLQASSRSSELLPVIRRYGDEAMDFIWKNKGALAVASVLASFLADPQVYIAGAKDLIVNPLVAPIAMGTNWTLIIAGLLIVGFLPLIGRRIVKARAEIKKAQSEPTSGAGDLSSSQANGDAQPRR